MAEGREYISRPDESGEVRISEEVLAMIAAAAATEVEGVSGLGAGTGESVPLKKGITRAVRLNVSEDQVAVDIALMVSYGYPIQEVARAVQDAVASAVENTCGLPVAGVNVSVTGVTFKR